MRLAVDCVLTSAAGVLRLYAGAAVCAMRSDCWGFGVAPNLNLNLMAACGCTLSLLIL